MSQETSNQLTIYCRDSFDIQQDIVVAVTPLLTEDQLRKSWRQFRDELMKKQTEDITEFTRWNFYLFYVVTDKSKINRSLKYEIEHNTISSRKIVVNENEVGDQAQNLIDNYIKFRIVSPQRKEEVQYYSPNQDLKDKFSRYENQED